MNRSNSLLSFSEVVGSSTGLGARSARAALPSNLFPPPANAKNVFSFSAPAAEGKGAKKDGAASASGLPRRKAGKLVFGGAAGGVGRESRAAEKAKAPEKKEEKKEEKDKFTAFQGSGNKLK